MDTWFTQQPLIQSIVDIGLLDVIGMVKDTNQRYLVDTRRRSLKQLYKVATPIQGQKAILRSIHTTIVFARYIVLSWQNRCNTDQRTLDGLFYKLCDEVSELGWAVALQQLIEILEDVLKKTNKKLQQLIKSQLQHWIASLPSYIKVYLPISVCKI